MADTIFTIGHSTRSAEELLDLLRAWGVEALVDVRRFPGSRRHPQFNRENLAASLAEAGIEYHHEEDLGGRRAAAPESANRYWRNQGFRGYADHMATPAFAAALERLQEIADRATVAVMCAEAVHWRCHRNLLSDALALGGREVRHIADERNASRHEPNAAARMGGQGVVVYEATEDESNQGQLDL